MRLITKVLHKDIELHSVPLENIEITNNTIKITYDDINEDRMELMFKTYQAFKITTIDCVSAQDYYNEFCYRDGIYHRHILEIINSPWIKSLKNSLTDITATFLDKAHHYFLLLGDSVLEIIAFDNYELKKLAQEYEIIDK